MHLKSSVFWTGLSLKTIILMKTPSFSDKSVPFWNPQTIPGAVDPDSMGYSTGMMRGFLKETQNDASLTHTSG